MKKFMKHYGEKFNMLRIILNREDPIIVEIGAHYGEDSMRFVEAFKNPTVHCFEPDPRNIKVFKKYIDHPAISLHEVALSSTDGKSRFYQSYDSSDTQVPEKYDWISKEDYKKGKLSNSGSSSLKRGYEKVLQESIIVNTSRYDTWYKKSGLGRVDFVWMDVQGAEKDVISGMGHAINEIKYIWMEYGETSYEDSMDRTSTINFMKERGFLEIPQVSNSGVQGDILFVNQSKIPL